MEVDNDVLDLGLCDDDINDDIVMSDDELSKELKILDEEQVKHISTKEVKIEVKQEDEEEDRKEAKHLNKEKKKDFDVHRNNGSNDNKDFKYRNDEKRPSKQDRSFRDSSGDIDYKRLHRYLEVDKKMEPMIVGREIAYRLHERKMELFGHVVRILGIDIAMEIFSETKEIVKRGGLKVDSGDRKRSPGGIFLYVLKNRAYASDEQIKAIFKHEKEREGHRKKMRNRREKERTKVKSQYLENEVVKSEVVKSEAVKSET